MNLHPIFSLYYPKRKRKTDFCGVFRGSDDAYLSNITPDFGIVIVDINLQVSPNNDCIVMEVISVVLSVFYLS